MNVTRCYKVTIKREKYFVQKNVYVDNSKTWVKM